MKKILLFIFILLSGGSVFSQIPGITYQAVIMNSDGQALPGVNNSSVPLSDQQICLKFLFKDASGKNEYEEIISTKTDSYGMVNVVIGTGERIGGSFPTYAQIVWDAEAKFLEVSLDKEGLCANFVQFSSQQFTAVPFSLFAANSGSSIEGPQGPVGLTGAQGEKGETGAKGGTGLTGDQGPIGLTGAKGDTGLKGDTGTQGIQGEAGLQGIKGDKGDTGDQGIQGERGESGADGQDGKSAYEIAFARDNSIGDEAAWLNSLKNGPQGIQGETGPKGDKGEEGPQGDQGIQGPIGPQGVQGEKGDTGEKGNTGDQGLKGDTGDQGIKGEQGETGLTGEQGVQGIKGDTGAQGIQGEKGDTGLQGKTGEDGLSAYAVAVNNGFIGTEAEWLISLEASQDISGIIVNATDIDKLETEQTTQNTAIALNTAKTGITTVQANIIAQTSGTNTGDQDISGIVTNAGAITTLQTEQTTQNTAIALNTAKVGITNGTAAGQMQYWNGTAWVLVPSPTNAGAVLTAVGGVPTWVGGTPPPPSVTSAGGKTWMDRNLGATQVATSSTDADSYGDLYQWGRGTDGHQIRTSGTTTTLSSTDTPGDGNFILAPDSPNDWRSPQNDNLWQGVNGTNNPCPSGYRIPTESEWEVERLSWTGNNAAGAFDSPLKLPAVGGRDYGFDGINSPLFGVGTNGNYWSSTVSSTDTRALAFRNVNAAMVNSFRAGGYAVRCLKD